MNLVTQIYVANADGELERIDLFKDEAISITDTIQDVRDIAKVFTEFSQSFTVPASRNNNKIFRHFYNADITDGFDSRILSEARIEINSIPFKNGFITLEGVNMTNNIAESYRITFYGETVTLRDIIGDDKLSNLLFDESLNQTYSAEEIYDKLKADPATNDVIVPLITHTQRLYYDSGSHGEDDGNLHYDTGGGTGHNHGVRWNELKYALRVHKIVEAIENTYGLNFSNDFFDSSNTPYYNLFMWLHRKKGAVESLSGFIENLVDEFGDEVSGDPLGEYGSYNGTYYWKATETYIEVKEPERSKMDRFELYLQNPTSNVGYNIRITRNGEDFFSADDISGDTILYDNTLGAASSPATVSGYSNAFTWEYQPGIYQIYISSTAQDGLISFSPILWSLISNRFYPQLYNDFSAGSFNVSADFPFVISQQIPDMGVIDFLTGLFKMFNLTALVESDGTIYVDTLDEFYVDKQSADGPYDIDEFVDATKHTVDSALPYREITFKYGDTGSLLAKQHEQIAGTVWAEETFDRFRYNQVNPDQPIQNNLSGETYTVEVPFGHMKYEKMLNLDDNNSTTIVWGYSAGDNFNESTGNYDSYIGKPLLFYPIQQSAQITGEGSVQISFVNSLTAEGDPANHFAIPVGQNINMPSNSVGQNPATTSANINFKAELNEWTGEAFLDTLFKVYYETYITQLFTKSNRIIKLKAYLPLRILLNYTLADKFIYKGRKHQINSITTNLTTGESEIELLNIVIE